MVTFWPGSFRFRLFNLFGAVQKYKGPTNPLPFFLLAKETLDIDLFKIKNPQAPYLPGK